MKKLVIFLTIVSFFSCKSRPVITDVKSEDPGWEMFNYPRTNMQPGYVFRIKYGENIPQEVTTLKAKKPFDTASAILPEIYRTKQINGSGFLKFLSLNSNDSTLQAKSKKEYEMTMTIGKGYQESIDEPTIDSLVKNSKINWRDNNRYYIIQATLATKKIRYKSLKKSNFESNLAFNLSKLNAAGHITKDKTDSTVLNQDFDRNYRVYYRAIEINSMGAGISNEKKFTYDKVKIKIED